LVGKYAPTSRSNENARTSTVNALTNGRLGMFADENTSIDAVCQAKRTNPKKSKRATTGENTTEKKILSGFQAPK